MRAQSSQPRDASLSADQIAIYARVSTEEQAEKPESSLDNQFHRCRQYLMAHEHSPEVAGAARCYREEGFSGKDTNRPELQRLLRDIKGSRIKLLVFTELSRVSRSLSDFLTLSRILKEHGVQFVSLREHFDTSVPHGRLIMVVLVALYEFERETTSLRTRLALRDRAERGLFNGGQIPLGYEPDSATRGLRIVPEEAEIVREAFKLYLETGALHAVANELKRRGMKRSARTSRRGKSHPGSDVSWNTVAHLLHNPTYVGLKEVNRAKKDLPEEEALALAENERYRLVDAVWEPLVDMDTYERVQELLAENYSRRKNAVAPKEYDYVLQGVVQCGMCGTVLEGGSAKSSQYFYYRHPTGTRKPECGQASWQAEVVEGAVLGRLGRLADDTELLNLVIAKANERIEDAAPDKARALEVARKKLSTLEGSRENFMANLMAAPAGSIPAVYWEKAKTLEHDVELARVEVSRLVADLHEISGSRISVEDYRTALQRFRDVYGQLDPVQRSNLLAYLLDRVELRGQEMTIALLGEVPETGRLEAFTGDGDSYSRISKWLRL